MNNTMKTHYIVQTASTRTGSRFGEYRRVAVLEVPAGTTSVTMISERSVDVICVVETWERLNVGTTARCAYERAYAAASKLAAELNEIKTQNRARREWELHRVLAAHRTPARTIW